MENRDFKGVWIPKEIWLNENLDVIEKVLYAEIDSLTLNGECYASNEYFAEFLKTSETKVKRALSKLISLGLVERVSFDGRKRVLASTQVKKTFETGQNDLADRSKRPTINIYNNTINNIDDNISSTKSKSYDDDVNFVGFWEMYPRKVGKSEAFKAWNKSIKCASIDDIANGLDKWINYWKAKRTDVQYIPHPATWLNGKNWEAFPEVKCLENYVVEIDGDNF